MLFNSLNFAIFLPIVFILYWFVANKKLQYQNLLLLVSSYFFYACWDYRFLFLLFFSTLLDYFTGLKMFDAKNQASKRFWFWLSIIVNLGFLGVFKYYNFFASSFSDALSTVGIKTNFWVLTVALPIGISFYTFHGLSYVIDIYYDRIKPEKNLIVYSVFVSFFPLLVAGPIERPMHLLPQMRKTRIFNYSQATDGLRQILWGFLKKIVIADTCAEYVNTIFNDYSHLSGSTLLLGIILFAFQIYGDFSGYSDIALGAARLFGIDLMRNFAFPYFSQSISEFWRRWHISLSSWFNDYLFFPIVTEKRNWGKGAVAFGILVTFCLSGFWHGAGWNFIVYGMLHGIAVAYEFFTKKLRKNIFKQIPQGLGFRISILITFLYVCFAFIFFRAHSLKTAISYVGKITSNSLFKLPYFPGIGHILPLVFFLIIFFVIEWFGKDNQYAIQKTGFKWKKSIRWSFYYTLVLIVLFYAISAGSNQQFIYFQF